MSYPLVRDLAADGIPVAVTCRVLGFSRQAFYSWRAAPVSEHDLVDAYATNAAVEVHADDPGFGYRFIADEVIDAGHAVSERRMWRLCSQANLVSLHARKRGKSRRPGPPVHDDLVKRDFTSDRPNRLWLTDITEHPTREGKLYLCAVKDAWSRRILGYAIDDRITSHLAVDALRMAVARRGGLHVTAGCVVHRDRGSQGGFNWSSQHLERGGVDGQASGMDEGVHGAGADEVAGRTVAPSGGRAGVLEGDRQGSPPRGGSQRCGRVAGGRKQMVPPRWRHVTVRPQGVHGQVPVLP